MARRKLCLRQRASAAQLRHDPALSPYEVAFEAESILRPTGGWQRMYAEFQALVCDNFRILNLVMKPQSYGLRVRVWDSMEVTRGPRITDSDLRGYHRPEPGWIADRISCLSIAAEIVRIVGDQEPAFKTIRQILESNPGAKQLLIDCRTKLRATHSSCHFPEGTINPVSKLAAPSS